VKLEFTFNHETCNGACSIITVVVVKCIEDDKSDLKGSPQHAAVFAMRRHIALGNANKSKTR
jgi:hypothetical protein